MVSDHGLIEDCLESIARSHPSVDTEVVVVANGLNDHGLTQLRKHHDIVLVCSAVNAGFSGGNNLAARIARGRYLLLLNDDSVVEAGFIDRLLRAIERDPLVAAAGGRTLSADGSLLEAGSVLWNDGWVAHVGSGLRPETGAYQFVRYTDWISANGLLIDRRAWDAIGGLDERYFPAYYEDVDLCLALWSAGHRVVYEPRARLRHVESQSTSTLFRNFLVVRNRAELVAKWSSLLSDFQVRPNPIDDAAIDAAVLRAERSNGRVLVLEDSADLAQWHLVDAVQALATAGWSVMVSVPVGPRREGSADADLRDRMVDLGVDIQEEPLEGLLSAHSSDIEAVVVRGDGTGVGPVSPRPDGSAVPLVLRGEETGSVVARVAAVVRQKSETESLRSGAAFAGGQPVATPALDVRERDQKFTEAEAEIQREYRRYLEHELLRLQDTLDETDVAFRRLVESFDEKERYIESLFSVRVKQWILNRLPHRRA